jgi:hypothetical protein
MDSYQEFEMFLCKEFKETIQNAKSISFKNTEDGLTIVSIEGVGGLTIRTEEFYKMIEERRKQYGVEVKF